MPKITWKFENKSDYRTPHLKAIIRQAAKQVWAGQTPNSRTLLVAVQNGRGMSVSCAINQGSGPQDIYISLPKDGVDKARLACDVMWCLGRLRGWKNSDMKGSPKFDRNNPSYKKTYEWADALPLDKKPAARGKLTGAGLAFKNAEHAQDMVHRWESKVKAAQTKLKKWRRKLRYYESRGERLQLEWAKKLQQGGSGESARHLDGNQGQAPGDSEQ